MNRIIVKSKVSSDGVLHLQVSVGPTEANKEVQVIVEPAPPASPERQRTMSADDLLHSGLVGMWAGRGDIGDSREFARRLRQQAQSRG